jgi:2-dehydropantoate 2-reductase
MGAGAIGSVFGGFLAKAGNRVTLVGRAWHLDAIRQRGLRISGIWGSHTVSNLICRRAVPTNEPCDQVLLSVKSYQTREAVQQLRDALDRETPILSLQNGLGNIEVIAEMIGVDRTVGGRVIFGAEIPEPGAVTVTVYADPVAIGPVRGSRLPLSTSEKIAAVIEQAGIPCLSTGEIERYIWGKVLYNAALNAPAAILEVPYGALLEHDTGRQLMAAVIHEAFAVAHAEGISLDWTSPEAYRKTLFDRLIPSTASHFPSMLQDIHRGKETEIDALNGAIARLGKHRGVPTPVNETLTRLIRFKEAAAIRRSEDSPNP